SLTLHNPVWLNHLPYLPFPDTFPVYLPKDKLANWLEFYADAMELNVWTSTELESGSFDDHSQRWTARLLIEGGRQREVHPSHIILATGASGLPYWPTIPGMDSFRGTLVHSAEFQGGERREGAKAIVFGTGNS